MLLLLLFYYLIGFGIYLYLVIANKILTNFKSNAQPQPSSLVSLTLYELPPLVSSCTLFPTTCWAMNVCELTLAVSHPPTGQEQVPQDEALGGCCDVFVRGLGRRLPVNFGLLDRFLIWCNYLIIFVQNSCYIVKMWHSILCHYASYVWDLVPAHLVFMFAPGFWTPKIRVWQDYLGEILAWVICLVIYFPHRGFWNDDYRHIIVLWARGPLENNVVLWFNWTTDHYP
jgi:hypothetical protein